MGRGGEKKSQIVDARGLLQTIKKRRIEMSKMIIEIDGRTGEQKVKKENGEEAESVALKDLIFEENIGGKVVRHKVLSISDGALIRTNPCTWKVINGVLYKICY